MKPPPRKRTKKDRDVKLESVPRRSGKVVCQLKPAEQRKLLNALKRLSKAAGDNGDIDYDSLRIYVPRRSNSEIHSVVESLKNKVISCADFNLKKKRWEEKRVRKPIEMWTHMASTVAGTLEESISTAFSQMLIVSSTEPRTLRNCDPPQVRRPPTDKDRPVGRTVPLRPVPHSPVEGKHPGTNTAQPLQVPTMGPVVRVPNSQIHASQQQLSTTVGTLPAVTPCLPAAAKTPIVPFTSPQTASQTVTPVPRQVGLSSSSAAAVKAQSVCSPAIQATQQPSEQHPITTNSTSKSTSSSPQTPHSSPTGVTPVPSATPSSSCTTPPLSTPAAEFHERFGRTSKYSTKDSPRMFGVKCVVDFERIYCYLSAIHKPNEECHLTPMESAIVLDLLMSLPEELPLLDCNKLHTHLVQIYQGLSSPADSRSARELFNNLKDGHDAQTEAPSGQATNRARQHNTAGTADSSNVSDSGGKKLQPDDAESQSSENNNTCSQSGDTDLTGSCPPLNPFMMPLKLLKRREVGLSHL